MDVFESYERFEFLILYNITFMQDSDFRSLTEKLRKIAGNFLAKMFILDWEPWKW